MLVWQIVVLLLVSIVTGSYGTYKYPANSPEWNHYKMTFGKSYTTASQESTALYYFNYNMGKINKHNSNAALNKYTYTLSAGPFTDLPQATYFAKFPQVTQPISLRASIPPTVLPASPTYDPRDMGIPIQAQFQGTVCNSGWAYATAAAIQIRKSAETLSTIYTPLSAQNLIDCAGATLSCTKQVSQVGFDYTLDQPIHTTTVYRNQNALTNPSFCVPPLTTAVGQTRLIKYARIADGNNELLKQYVSNGYPVVVEFNPNSFQFMNYGGGIFQLPSTSRGSHYLTVIGYGIDIRTANEYWIALNSFGENWGEKGLIRIARSASLAKSALFPTELSFLN